MKKSTSVIYCRITIAGQRAGDFTTGVKMPLDAWNAKTQRANVPTKGNGRAALLEANTRLEQIFTDLQNTYNRLTAGGKQVSAKAVKDAYLTPETTLQAVAQRYYQQQQALCAAGKLSSSTLQTYTAKNNLLQEFSPDLPLADVTRQWLKRYENWLLTVKRFGTDHTGRNLGYVKMLLRFAVGEELLPYSPIDHCKVQRGKPDIPVFLTDEELNRLRRYTTDSAALLRTRDLFLFQCLTGIAYTDLKQVNTATVSEENGGKWLRIKQQKSGELSLVPLLPEAEGILRQYNNALPITCLQIHNRRLKQIAADCHIRKPVSSHIGRKTFATMMLNKGVSIEAVAAMLGHSSVEMTRRHYARVSTVRLQRELQEAGLLAG
ncbi:tyrosine-type recombinase/integrase [Rhodoflexus caldus]|uniref:tyrosine-type recombinase/integrase n=1 Tax=Rhodoflexus caldus TaxID=2891236 RepID=UPI002029E725|nr:site-specific integrase [Rhodoflexus caldus]